MTATAPSPDLKWALAAIRSRAPVYRKARAYYDGDHPLRFAGEKFTEAFAGYFREFAVNYCPVVVETLADRLQVAGFRVSPEGEEETERAEGAPPTPEEMVREWWRRGRMEKRAGEVHGDAIADGDAYVIVWKGRDGTPTFYPNRAANMTVRYDPEEPGYITRAAKAWIDDEDQHARLTLYYRDRIEKYRTRNKAQGGIPEDGNSFAPFDVEGESWPLPNPYDKVPVFHFANRASIGEMGRSEMRPAFAPQDAFNKTICDMVVGSEFHALPQRWAIGLQEGEDPKLKTGGVWAVADKEVKFGQFDPADLSHFLAAKADYLKDIARTTRTPMHYFTLEGSFPSGEALKTADQPLLAKVRDRQISFGVVWADVIRFALEIGGVRGTDPETLWRDTQPRNETEAIGNAQGKIELGMSKDAAARELGYEQAEIERWREERAAVDIVPDTDQ